MVARLPLQFGANDQAARHVLRLSRRARVRKRAIDEGQRLVAPVRCGVPGAQGQQVECRASAAPVADLARAVERTGRLVDRCRSLEGLAQEQTRADLDRRVMDAECGIQDLPDPRQVLCRTRAAPTRASRPPGARCCSGGRPPRTGRLRRSERRLPARRTPWPSGRVPGPSAPARAPRGRRTGCRTDRRGRPPSRPRVRGGARSRSPRGPRTASPGLQEPVPGAPGHRTSWLRGAPVRAADPPRRDGSWRAGSRPGRAGRTLRPSRRSSLQSRRRPGRTATRPGPGPGRPRSPRGTAVPGGSPDRSSASPRARGSRRPTTGDCAPPTRSSGRPRGRSGGRARRPGSVRWLRRGGEGPPAARKGTPPAPARRRPKREPARSASPCSRHSSSAMNVCESVRRPSGRCAVTCHRTRPPAATSCSDSGGTWYVARSSRCTRASNASRSVVTRRS